MKQKQSLSRIQEQHKHNIHEIGDKNQGKADGQGKNLDKFPLEYEKIKTYIAFFENQIIEHGQRKKQNIDESHHERQKENMAHKIDPGKNQIIEPRRTCDYQK